MPISTTCPHCRRVYSLADHLQGKKIRCKDCGEVIAVGGSTKTRGADAMGEEESGRQTRIQSEARRPNRAARRRDDEDDDDDERPRRREYDDDSPRRKRKSNRGLIIGLIAGGVVLLLLLLGGGIFAVVRIRDKIAAPRLASETAPPGTVIVHVDGVANNHTREIVGQKLGKLADNGQGGWMATSRGNRAAFRITPVRDVKAFAAKIDFATVSSVDGQSITLVLDNRLAVPDANADIVTKTLFEIKSIDGPKRSWAIKKLSETLPDDQRRAEVCKVLEPFLNDPDHFTREWTRDALGVWGTKQTVPLLLKTMNDKEGRPSTIKALGRLKDERAIEPIADRLEDFFDRGEAVKALKNMGAMAEEAVIKRLQHPENDVRKAACDILKTIGTNKSIPALQKVVAEKNFFLTRPAEEAIRVIKARTAP